MSTDPQETPDPFTPEQRAYINEFLSEYRERCQRDREHQKSMDHLADAFYNILWDIRVTVAVLSGILVRREVTSHDEIQESYNRLAATLAIETATNPKFAEFWRMREQLDELQRQREELNRQEEELRRRQEKGKQQHQEGGE